MKKIFLVLVFLSIVSMAMADWSYGTCRFVGNMPSNGMTIGGVRVWYNGTLRATHVEGGVQYWEGTNEICVAFPKNYMGQKLVFLSTGGMVQIQYEQ